MKLNCKQGDIAIIVRSECGNEGKIVRCLELLVTDKIPDTQGNVWGYRSGRQPVWRIDRTINFGNGIDTVQVEYCSDKVLRPLRGDIDDETIEHRDELSTVV